MKIKIDIAKPRPGDLTDMERVTPNPKMKRLHGPEHPWNKRASAAYFKKNGRFNSRPQVLSDLRSIDTTGSNNDS